MDQLTSLLPAEHPCKNVFDTFVSDQYNILQKQVESATSKFRIDVRRFAQELSDLKVVKVYHCFWFEDYGNEYESKHTKCEQYFLHEFQALSFQANKVGCTVHHVDAYYDHRFKYYIFEGTTKTSIYVEFTPEDKRKQNDEIRISNLKYELQLLQNGRK